jgi:excisionase family DNA binding protein
MTENFIDAPAAVISGWPAYALARTLRRHLPELVDVLDPALRRPLEEAMEALTLAGEAFAQGRRETTKPARVETRIDLVQMNDEMTADQAAQMLDCSTQWIRRLAGEGRIPARRIRRVWRIDAAAIRELHMRRSRC